MTAKETIYETTVSDARWWAYDIPGNAGWIAFLVCLVKSLKRGLNAFNMTALLPGGLMLLGVGELISERIVGLDRVLPKRLLLRGFGALTTGGIGGMIVSAFGLATQKEKKHPAFMLIGSALCALASGRKILLLDEPTSGLDYAHMMETAALFKQLQSQGATILVVTHDSELIRACCSRRLLFSAQGTDRNN